MKVDAFGIWFRDWLNARDARKLSRAASPPPTVEKAYWHETEYAPGLDAARGARIRGRVEVASDPYVSATLPADTGGVMGHLSRTVRRRVPSIHVIYQRTPAGAAHSSTGPA